MERKLAVLFFTIYIFLTIAKDHALHLGEHPICSTGVRPYHHLTIPTISMVRWPKDTPTGAMIFEKTAWSWRTADEVGYRVTVWRNAGQLIYEPSINTSNVDARGLMSVTLRTFATSQSPYTSLLIVGGSFSLLPCITISTAAGSALTGANSITISSSASLSYPIQNPENRF